MTVSNTLFSSLFTDPEVAALFSADAMLDHMADYERALTQALADTGAVPADMAAKALERMETFTPDIDAVTHATGRDGAPVPAFVRQLKDHVGDAESTVHIGATSQDLLDTSTVLSLRGLSDLLSTRLDGLIAALHTMRDTHGANSLMGRTRMQAALPITVADRVTTWAEPLARHLDRLAQLRPRIEVVQHGGPVGLRDGADVARRLADHFRLRLTETPWHAMRDGMVEYGNWLSLVSGSLGKIGQDIALMAQQGVDAITLSGGGESSAMAHKQNPVRAELLVTLARHNAALVGGLNHALIHEQERSGSAWALEWMILPQMAETTGKALTEARALIGQVEAIGDTHQ
ncbi:3-carboxy-cis,cis-muconate cycloisomerase [Aliiroseovarius sp. YM-037]|uniref:3-carboxy-cis,cis-muconate cycloisomerase n=1 Tax=Aliiroseovarius sp. YM-037 TaxID=3341728 RepID=UPI003A80FC09